MDQLLANDKSVLRGNVIDTTVKGLLSLIFAVFIEWDGHIQEIVLGRQYPLLQVVTVHGGLRLAIDS